MDREDSVVGIGGGGSGEGGMTGSGDCGTTALTGGDGRPKRGYRIVVVDLTEGDEGGCGRTDANSCPGGEAECHSEGSGEISFINSEAGKRIIEDTVARLAQDFHEKHGKTLEENIKLKEEKLGLEAKLADVTLEKEELRRKLEGHIAKAKIKEDACMTFISDANNVLGKLGAVLNKIVVPATEGCENQLQQLHIIPAATGSDVSATTGSKVPATTGSIVPATTGSEVQATTGSKVPATTGSEVQATTGSKVPATTESEFQAATGSEVWPTIGGEIWETVESEVTVTTENEESLVTIKTEISLIDDDNNEDDPVTIESVKEEECPIPQPQSKLDFLKKFELFKRNKHIRKYSKIRWSTAGTMNGQSGYPSLRRSRLDEGLMRLRPEPTMRMRLTYPRHAGQFQPTSCAAGTDDSQLPPPKRRRIARSTREEEVLLYHKLDENRATSGYYCCCGKQFSNLVTLGRHFRYNNEDWKFRCGDCTKVFFSSNYLRVHTAKVHGKPLFGVAGCTRCGKMFESHKDAFHHRKKCSKK